MRTHVIIHKVNSDAIRARRTQEDWVTYLEIESGSSWDEIEEAMVMEFMTGGDFVEFIEGKVMGFAAMPPAVRIGLGLDE